MRHDNRDNQRAPNKSNETHVSHVRGRVTGKARKKAKAAGALRNIVFRNVENKAAIVAAGGIEPLVALAREGTPEQKTQAAGALSSLAWYTEKKAIAVARGIEPLVALAREGTPDQKLTAATALWGLACDDAENQTAIAAAGGIHPHVAFASVGGIDLLMNSARSDIQWQSRGEETCCGIMCWRWQAAREEEDRRQPAPLTLRHAFTYC